MKKGTQEEMKQENKKTAKLTEHKKNTGRAEEDRPVKDKTNQDGQQKPRAARAKNQKKQGKYQMEGQKQPRSNRWKKRRKAKPADYIPRNILNQVWEEQQELRAKILDYMAQETYQPLKAEELGQALSCCETSEKMTVFLQLLRKMELEYDLVQTKKQRYLLPQQAGILQGQLLAHGKGFGFVRTGQQGWPDIHISKGKMNSAMHKDQVLVKLFEDPRKLDTAADYRPEGEIVKVIKRANLRVIGTFDLLGSSALVYPDERRLPVPVEIPANEMGAAQPGDKVVAEIIRFATKHHPPLGKIVRVLGGQQEAGVDMLSVLWQYGLPEEFPEDVLQAAANAAQPITEADLQGRRDRRQQPLVTIDGSDAKDLDDAVGCRVLANGNYELSVHIADVSHYVLPGTVLDQEAFGRATSVYLPDRVLPMLPPVLSNGMCSLNAGEDRLALSCTMEITPRGRIAQSDIYPSIIRVGKRFSYDVVNQIVLEHNPLVRAENQEWLELLEALARLQKILEKKRLRRGAINFNFPETKVIVDAKTGKPLEVQKRVSRLAEKMIEEAMIITNEVVADTFYHRRVPFIYRVHKGPGEEKLSALNEAIGPLGYGLAAMEDGVQPKDLQKLLQEAEGKPEAGFVQLLALRSMSHALYSPEATGHFGLASKYYSHFTSPIRRYPDLAIHRAIKEWSQECPKGEAYKKLYHQMELAAQQASDREKMAEEAEREAVDVKCCQFMVDKIGEAYEGKVSGVTANGIFVELENTIEGRIAVTTLPFDDYRFLPHAMTLKGSRNSWRLGDEITVRVSGVNLTNREIDFELVMEL